MMALKVSRKLEHKRSPLADAWFARAERLLEGKEDAVEYGFLVRQWARKALTRDSYEEALEHAERTLAIGIRHGERNLMALGLHDKGSVLVQQGKVDEGLGLLDEATIAAVSGELGSYTTAVVYCGIIAACRDLGDFGRAGDWTEAAKSWCDRQAISGFPGVCRVNRAEIMRLLGAAGRDAEEEIHRAVDELARLRARHRRARPSTSSGSSSSAWVSSTPPSRPSARRRALGTDPYPGLALLRLARVRHERGAARHAMRAVEDEKGQARPGPAADRARRRRGRGGRCATHARAAAEELEGNREEYRLPGAPSAGRRAAGGPVALDAGSAGRRARPARRAVREVGGRSTPPTRRRGPGSCRRGLPAGR